jgi:uncharacterized OB-fold protein
MKKPKPEIRPTDLSRPFWDGVAAGRLLLQYDPAAQRYQFYPRPLSLFGAGPLEWRPASGRGTLIAQKLCHAPAPGFDDEVPYLLGIVALEEGPRIFARIVNAEYAGLRIGQAMRLAWDDTRADRRLYQFEPA